MLGNWLKTSILMAGILALFGAIGASLGGAQGMMIALLIGGGMNIFSYWFSDKMVLRMYNAQEVDEASSPYLYNMVKELAARADLPMPKVYLIDQAQPNAFATGRNPAHAAVAATTGIVQMLSARELRGVMAHELAHVKHRDILISTISATMAGAISMLANFAMFFGGRDENGRSHNPVVGILVMILAPLAASLIQMAISRAREFEADRGGAEISGEPDFKTFGATSSDHGHLTARTENLSQDVAAALFDKALRGACSAEEADKFRGHMLTEMARMSLEDGLVLQIHPGSQRNHSNEVMSQFGRDKGYDIPTRTDYVHALKPLLDAVGSEPDLTIILFTLDESCYTRELAPLAGIYPALKLGPPWWFHDSAEGMRRFREMTTETAGFYNTVGFNDDTRAFCSIPARHDVARRVDCSFLASLVATGRLDMADAPEVAYDLAYRLAKEAYRL